MLCSTRTQSQRVTRPDWYGSGSVVVTDPFYGPVSLALCPFPLKCWKSSSLADGSYWMWLADPWHYAAGSPLAGLLFFAPSYEYWRVCTYVSQNQPLGSSGWTGAAGTGRVSDQAITVQAAPAH